MTILPVSSYDNRSVPWGSTHEETLKEFPEKYPYVSGACISGRALIISYEPTPYPFPAAVRISALLTLQVFQKDATISTATLFTDKDVLHTSSALELESRATIDVWAYYNHADKAELFQWKITSVETGDDLHVMWRVVYEPGNFKSSVQEPTVKRY